MIPSPGNRATLWAQTFVDELYRAGLRRVSITPGSRSTPLTVAFAQHPGIRHYIHLDERSAAFFALGMALESEHPTALVCTSGTAAAEFFPAIIEASLSRVPLLALTADRPAELRDSGANQTIDQLKLYGGHVRWSVDAAPPEKEAPRRVLRYLRALADRAMATSLGLEGAPGPVHINFPFRKPLESTPVAGDVPTYATPARTARGKSAPWTRIQIAPLRADAGQVTALAGQIRRSPRGLIIAGPRSPAGDFPAALCALSRATGYPILATPLSGLRFSPHTRQTTIIAGYELALKAGLFSEAPVPQIVLRFGALPISQPLCSYLESLPAEIPQIGIDPHGRWQDAGYTLSDFIAADPATLCADLVLRLEGMPQDHVWAETWLRAEAQVRDALAETPTFEGNLVAQVVQNLPPEARLFVANSLPIRHVDAYAPARRQALRLYANRGASGIDGTISTALGIAAASPHPLTLITGDLSFYHDQNGLFALRRHNLKATIVLINNNGGGIFHRLPIANFEPPFNEMFVTPHGLDFRHTAALYGLAYRRIQAEELATTLSQAWDAPESYLLEIRTDAAHSEQVRHDLIMRLKTQEETHA